jgi:SAM-dependent methyltransferase
MTKRLIPEQWRKSLKRIPFVAPTVRLVRALNDPQLRDTFRLQRDQNSGLLQPSSKTSPDRYPNLFAFVQDWLKDTICPSILSYGCSTGDEVFSLRHYFPKGRIKGIDINTASIKTCFKRLEQAPDVNILFGCAASPKEEPTEHYDAIFCMAVLRHGALQEHCPDRCDPHIRFDDVAALVSDLARCLKPGGLFITQNSHFRFADLPVAAQFDAVWSDHRSQMANYPLYGPDNVRLDIQPYRDAVFRKSIA